MIVTSKDLGYNLRFKNHSIAIFSDIHAIIFYFVKKKSKIYQGFKD